MNLENGSIINQYKIISSIGKGGMGEVFLAQDTKLDRKVALKILPPEFAADADRMSRFVREAKSASALNHPNIITIHEIGESDGTHFITTEFIDGKTLNEYKQANPLNYKSALEIAIQIASALDEAHLAGIVHRDIKPDNIMIRSNGLAKILDFGIAKVTATAVPDEEAATAILAQTQAGMIIGTPNYMSPEQARGKDVDHQTDIFSFGVVFYEMLSGDSPFSGETVSDVIAAVLTKVPKKLNDIPPELEGILSKTLEKDKKVRYQTAKDLLIDLQEAKEELSVQSRLEKTSSPNIEEPKTQILQAQTTAEDNPKSQIPNLKSIAVLPFTNMSADEDNEYFCDGLAEELLNALSKINDLKVAARTSAFSFKGKNANVSEIGEKLGVRNVLEGSVRKSGSKLRISVQLVNAADGYQLWSERYDREMEDIFDVQDEIALAVVDSLKLKLFGDEKAELLKRGTENVEAYQFYLKGLYYWNKRDGENIKKAIEQFKAAADIDPNYALAFVGLADCYVILPYYTTATSTDVLPQAKTYATRALEIDNSLGEAHASLAYIYSQSWNWAEAEKSFKRAVELNPNYGTARRWFAEYLVTLGRYDEAEIECKSAIELEPLSLINYNQLALLYTRKGGLSAALKQCQRAIELDPSWYFIRFSLALVYLKQGRNAEAIAEAEKSVERSKRQSLPLGVLGYIHAKSGRQTDAIKIVEELKERYQKHQAGGLEIARVYGGLGEKDQAFVWLEKEFQSRNQLLPPWLGVGWFDSLRDDPRYNDLLKRIGLPTHEKKKTDESLEAKTVMLSEPPAVAGGLTQTSQEPDKKITTANIDLQPSATAKPSSDKSRKTKYLAAGLLTLFLAVGGFFGYKYLSPTTTQINSIAVLPFENRSGNADSEYLSDGLAESLIYRLSQLPDLKVSPTSSVFRYKGKDADAQKIGGELGVSAVMFGRIVQRGDNLNISVELVDARNNKLIWGEQYERKMSELLATQREIAAAITNKLQFKLSGGEKSLTKKYTDNNEAYQLYLKARFHFARRTKEDILKSIELFREAIKLDPNFALAHVGVAESYAVMPSYPYLSPKEAMPQAKAAIAKALELDSELPEAHTVAGMIAATYDWDWAEAERRFKRSLELDANLAITHYRYAWVYLSPLGQHDEAIAEMKRAMELEPLSLQQGANFAAVLMYARQFDAAVEQAKKTYELDPNHVGAYTWLSHTSNAKGMYAESLSISEKYLQADFPSGGQAAYAYAKSGQRRRAEAIIKRWKEDEKTKYVMNYWVVIAYAALGEKDAAFAELEKAYQARDWFLPRIKVDPFMDSLRDDPRFKDLLKRMNLPE